MIINIRWHVQLYLSFNARVPAFGTIVADESLSETLNRGSALSSWLVLTTWSFMATLPRCSPIISILPTFVTIITRIKALTNNYWVQLGNLKVSAPNTSFTDVRVDGVFFCRSVDGKGVKTKVEKRSPWDWDVFWVLHVCFEDIEVIYYGR